MRNETENNTINIELYCRYKEKRVTLVDFFNELLKQLEEKDKEIEKLNRVINGEFATICKEKMIDKLSATEMITLQEKEIERLKNIINELEKWSEEYRFANIFKNKLKELKGSDK